MCRSTLDFTCNKVNVHRRQRESRVGSALGSVARMATDLPALDLPTHILTLQRKISAPCHNSRFNYSRRNAERRYRHSTTAKCSSKEVAFRFLFVFEDRRCKQLRRLRCVPLREQVGIASNVVYHVYQISHSD